MSIRWIVPVLGCALLASCGPKARVTTFDPAEYAPYREKGTGVVAGQAFVRTAGGRVVTAAGREVYLYPATKDAEEWYQRSVIGEEQLEAMQEPGAREAVTSTRRKTLADADGRFTFEGLPAGDYYVTSLITWEVPVGYYGGGVASTRTERYVAHSKVTVRDGDVTQTIVTR